MTTTKVRDLKPIALRITDPGVEQRVNELSKKLNLSSNMTVNLLLGYAFNEVDRQDKKFEYTVMFESK